MYRYITLLSEYKHVNLPPGTENTYAYFQDTGLMGYLAAWLARQF
jgi:hypothetical protein